MVLSTAESTWRDPRLTSRALDSGGSEVLYPLAAKEIPAASKEDQAMPEAAGTKAQVPLAPRLPVLGWMLLLLLRSNDWGHPSEAPHPSLTFRQCWICFETHWPPPGWAEGLGKARQRHWWPCKAAAGAGMHRGPPGTRSSTQLFLCRIQNNKQEGACGHCFSVEGGDGERARGTGCQKARLS